jgi:hypothetical protein
MNKSQLLQLLAEQVLAATSLDGILGDDAAQRRSQACHKANETLALLETLGVDPEEALEEAERRQDSILGLCQTLASV